MKKILKSTIDDLVSDFIYYDRKEDEDLPLNEIENMINRGETNIDEIVKVFKEVLICSINSTH